MYDSDDILYYEGMFLCNKEECNGERGFEPLDGFGEPNAGCTRIDYYNVLKGEWRTL